ncbi:hypothetical protein HW555_000942 [Spodoptera exigua]|uniref:Uncharacterized protein n=1 Tax=Spodoptera exigua TaxID=7107 RepID=A0A835GRL1_SPOEX|nr:hypothetical protein HW555_000942 [Spodoptera exigua]
MRILVSIFTTVTLIVLISDVESYNHGQRVAQLMLENNITVPKTHKIYDYGNITRNCINTTKVCVWKCGPFGKQLRLMIYGKKNIYRNKKIDDQLNKVLIYDKSLQRTDKTLQDTLHLVPNHFSNLDFRMNSFNLNILFKTYLLEDGNLITEIPNDFNRFYKIDVNHFCVDINIRRQIVFYGVVNDEEIPEKSVTSNIYRVFALPLGMVLLAYVLVIYCIRSHLWDIHGMLVMTLICCYLGKNVIEFIHHFVPMHLGFSRLILEPLHIFCNLTCFSLTNVMFYNVWKSIRSGGNAINTHQNKFKQYIKYTAYGFGLPLILTISILIIDFRDMTHIPWFITPKLKYLRTCLGKEIILYIYIPGSIMLLYNIFICILLIPKAIRKQNDDRKMTNNDAIKYDVLSLSQYMKLLTFMTISEAANAYSLWVMKLFGIVSTNKWLLGVVIIIIFLRGSYAKRKSPATPVNQNISSVREMQ